MPIIPPFQGSKKFVSNILEGTGTGASFSIAAINFIDDAGLTITSFPTTFNYYLLYINGVLQLDNSSSVSATAINLPDGDTLDPSVPIMIEFIIR
ncbi:MULTISPECIES: DUF4183 domain-containing protein [unclassified Paenibacillus]|uniref:DUF4183 domain-containing protein n=1 Tax=unclassified Paenibacillus TaxID=185978 RepID=UPI0024BB956D|nr:DUF4183 domain-containing protein [Paenibacillus sp. RC334]